MFAFFSKVLFICAVYADRIRHLDYGSFMGDRAIDGKSITFYNIPFAAPPIGEFRFKWPQPPVNISLLGIQDSTKPGPACIVNTNDPINSFAHTSEDCLNLNVVMPTYRAKPGANFPVFVCKRQK